MNNAKTSFSTEIFAGAMITVVRYIVQLRCQRESEKRPLFFRISRPQELGGPRQTEVCEMLSDTCLDSWLSVRRLAGLFAELHVVGAVSVCCDVAGQ
jgi:hypothetical protein